MHSEVQKGAFQLVEVEQSAEHSSEDGGEQSHAIEGFLILKHMLRVEKD